MHNEEPEHFSSIYLSFQQECETKGKTCGKLFIDSRIFLVIS